MAKQEVEKAAEEPSLTQVLARMAELMAENQRLQQQQNTRIETENLNTAEARRAGRRLGPAGAYENAFPPDISAFNPKGERDHARPELKCKMIWVGYKLAKEALSREEIELLNQMKPGEYKVKKANGTLIDFTIDGKMGPGGTEPELLTFHFRCKAIEDRQDHRSMVSYLKDVLDPTRLTQGD